jgi:transcriptional regulator with XRE-family HTH domain
MISNMDVAHYHVGQRYTEIHSRGDLGDLSAQLPVGRIGTGGIGSAMFYRDQLGYRAFLFIESPYVVRGTTIRKTESAEMMREIRNAFGRTMTRLPEVFGVSRQTLYNWLDGEMPKPPQQEKLRQLARAARMFSEVGFKPTSLALDRTLSQGKSLLQWLAEGADGRETAKNLVRVTQRGAYSRAILAELLRGRRGRLEASDIGAPALDENS